MLSPTHDAYEKSSLIPATHRLEMARLTHTNFMERVGGKGQTPVKNSLNLPTIWHKNVFLINDNRVGGGAFSKGQTFPTSC